MKVTVRLKLNEDEWEDVRKHKEFRHIAPLSYCREFFFERPANLDAIINWLKCNPLKCPHFKEKPNDR